MNNDNDKMVFDSAIADGTMSAPNPGLGDIEMSEPPKRPERPERPENYKPWKGVYGKAIIPDEPRFCGIAYNDPTAQTGVKLCDTKFHFGDERTYKEHVTVTHIKRWGDNIQIASDKDIKRAIAAEIPFTRYSIPPRDYTFKGPRRKSSVVPQQVQITVTSAVPVVVAGHIPPAGTIFRSSYEDNGYWYVQHSDGAWYNHGSSN